MTVLAQRPAPVRARLPLRALATLVSWALAAALVALVGPLVAAAIGAGAALWLKVVAVTAVAGALATRPLKKRGLQPTPWTGLAWLALTIAGEIAVGLFVQAGWSELLGNPDVRWMRNVLMLSWLAAPALFLREHWW